MLLMSDDSVVLKQIEATHVPDGREVDTIALLKIVEDILNLATPTPTPGSIVGAAALAEDEDKTIHPSQFTNNLESLSFTIDRISCELACKCMGSSDVHGTAIGVLQLLTSHSWNAKLVLSLAAFALNYGEFWLLAQIYTSNPLARSMAILKKLPELLAHSGHLKPRLDSLNNLIRTMLGATKCINEFNQLPSAYISYDEPAFVSFKNSLPVAVYWIIRGIIVCASQIISLTSMGHEYMTTETWDLSTLAHKIRNIQEHLENQLKRCYELIEEKTDLENYEMLRNLFLTPHSDNMKVLRALIYRKDDILPLYDGSTKGRVNLEVLRRKNVLLLISGLDIQDELGILEQIYNESRQHMTNHYDIVWIPIVDPAAMGRTTSDPAALVRRPRTDTVSDPRVMVRTDTVPEQLEVLFDTLKEDMPWYTVHHPSLIDKAVVRFIRNDWHFKNKPILVVLDPLGRVANPNAIHMMWIWGLNAFPFATAREEALWRDEAWRLELLIDGIDSTVINWIKDGKYIFLYGGDDIEWIRKFTAEARKVAQAERVPLEMLYVGRSGKRDNVRKIADMVAAEKLSHSWQDQTMVWFFWIRLESMLFSKIQQGKADEHDTMTQEIKKLLSFDKMGGWAVLSNGSKVLINGQWAPVLATLTEYDLWRHRIAESGFDNAITDHHRKIHEAERPCSRFEFPSTAGRIPADLKCPECRRGMEKYITFLCCHDEPALGALMGPLIN